MLEFLRTPRGLALLALGLALLAVPPLAQALDEPFYISLVSRVLVFALAAMGLDLILGYGGLVCFGYAAFMGIGAYVVAILAHHAGEGTRLLGLIPGTVSGWIAWPLAMAAAAFAALLIGLVSLRTRGIYFIMITLAFAQMLYFLFVSLRTYGGDDGLSLASRSVFFDGLSLRDKTTFYYVALALLAGVGLLLARTVGARFGLVLRGAKANERRMIHLGFAVFQYRLAAFVLAGAIGGLAGALLANQANFVSPAIMHWTRSGELIVMVILGGMGSLAGPVVGALSFLLLEEALSGYTEHWQAILGPALLVVVIYARQGLWGLLPVRPVPVAVAAEPAGPPIPRRDDHRHDEAPAPLLAVEDLLKRFGALIATHHFSIEVRPGEIHALIGPNGAGKSTLVAQLAGELPSDGGRVRFAGRDITALPVPARVGLGLVRSFQITSLVTGFSARTNVALAIQARQGHSFRFWRPAESDPALNGPAAHYLARVGLGGRGDTLVESLSYGEQRQLEIAMALATEPRLLMLDEPLAGMGREDGQVIVDLLAGLRGQYAMLLIEHDMDAVFSLADRITVLVYGQGIATGSAAAIRANPDVQRAYLGEEAAHG